MDNLDYGVVGNCKTAALISKTGSVEWFCLPEFDSPSVFAKILDKEKGGHFSFEVSDKYKITQQYIANTNILSTIFKSEEGAFEVIDFMPRYHTGTRNEYYLPPELYRYVRVISGNPKLRVIYKPALNYARGETFHTIKDGYIESHVSSNEKYSIFLYSSVPFKDILEGNEITLTKNEFFLVSDNEKLISIGLSRVDLEYQRTRVYWLNWNNRSKKYSAYNNVITRSMLVLKLMSHYSGAVLAALTTSLPEVIGGVRNWDYRFCWLRDASMSIDTLFKMGHDEAARKFMDYIHDTFIDKYGGFQIMYGIRGEKILTEESLDHLAGYENSKPVRIGNDAYHQKQNDSFGYLMDVIYQYYRYFPGTLDEIEQMWFLVKAIASTVKKDWHKPDKGIWEIRGAEQHFVFSKVMCWVAMNRAAAIAKILYKDNYAEEWEKEAAVIKAEIFDKGWKEDLQSFTQAYDNNEMDSSLLLMEQYGFISADDPRYEKTVKAIKSGLFRNGLMYRYTAEDDFGKPSSAFTICTFWLVRALFKIGEKREAKTILDNLLTYSNHLGLFSEDLEFDNKRPLGNFPQAYSHLALINTCILFSKSQRLSRFIRP